jgi:hypothetical protein
MSGGYISCGRFEGLDKSGSPCLLLLREVLGIHESELAPQSLWRRLFRRNTAARSGWHELLLQLKTETSVSIPAELAREILPRLERYYEVLGGKLGYPSPEDAPELDRAAGLNMADAKWGKVRGEGWLYYCCADLIEACRISVRTRQPVELSFD